MTKTKIALITITTILLLGGATYAYLANSRDVQDRTSPDSGNDTRQNDNPQTTDKEPEGIDGKGDSKTDGKTYVDTPVSDPPETNDPYPVENEHYKIAQNSSTSFHITLYPIVNNPQYSDYDAQLKAYKNEALSYLKKRYESIDNFNIKWTPSDAEKI